MLREFSWIFALKTDCEKAMELQMLSLWFCFGSVSPAKPCQLVNVTKWDLSYNKFNPTMFD